MKKRLLIQSILVVIVGCVVGAIAIAFAGIVGTTSAAIAEDLNFGLVEGIICPEGTTIEIRKGQQWESSHDFLVSCVGKDGTRYDGMEGRALFAVLGMYFLVCFVPLFFPISLILWILVPRMAVVSSQSR